MVPSSRPGVSIATFTNLYLVFPRRARKHFVFIGCQCRRIATFLQLLPMR